MNLICATKRPVLLVAAALAIGAANARASMVTVTNPGFDYTTNDITNPNNTSGWTNGAGNVSFHPWPSGSATTASLPGWVSTTLSGGTSVSGVGAQQLNSSSANWYSNNYPGAGNAVGATNNGKLLKQTLTGALASSTSYTLSVSLFRRASDAFPANGNIIVQLRDTLDNVLVGGITSITAPTSSGPGVATFTVTTGLVTPGNLVIVLGDNTGGYSQVNFDNVTLSAVTAVPAPAALPAGLGLLAWTFARRRRSA